MVRLAIYSRSPDAHRKLEELHCSQDSLADHLKQNFKIFKKDLRRTRKISMVILYAWLFMNTDPSYSARTIGSMMAQRMLSRSLLRPLAGDPGPRSSNGGLSTVEAIALIQAINSNNRGPQQSLDVSSLKNELGRQERQSLISTAISDRQRPVPVPVPLPAPIPAAVIVAFVSAFFAAVAAGSSPINAFFAAFIALIVALAINKPEKKNDKALIKKLVIKKSVLPFVIPIPFPIPFPIPYKKGYNEVVYKYIPKPEHHHHHHEKKKKHKYKKSDEIEEKQSHDELDKIESLIAEQDRIQRVMDSFVKHKDTKSVGVSD